MARAKLTESGRCIITGRTNVPMIDTGKTLRGHGRVHVSISGMFNTLRQAGWIPPAEAEDLRAEAEDSMAQAEAIRDKAESFDTLTEVLSGYLQIEPEVIKHTVVTHRAPNDQEIEDWIRRNGADHPAVRVARPSDPGSSEEWHRLYDPVRSGLPVGEPTPDLGENGQEATAGGSGEGTTEDPVPGPAATFELQGSEVNLDEILAQSVKDIVAYVEGHPVELQHALLEREAYLAKQEDKEPRKSLVEALDSPEVTSEGQTAFNFGGDK